MNMFLRTIACLLILGTGWAGQEVVQTAEPAFRLATFAADVTPPIGHPLLANTTITPAAIRKALGLSDQ